MSQSIWERRFRSAAAVLSVGVIVLGVMVLAGWIFDVAVLKSVIPGFTPMKVNTASSFIAIGIALWLQDTPGSRAARTRQLLGGVVATLAVLTLIEYGSGVDLGIDQALFRGNVHVRFPGRMAPETALMFLLLATTVILGEGRWSTRVKHVAGTLALAGSLVIALGYLYGATSFYEIGAYTAVTIHTSVGFVMAACAFLMAHPGEGLTRLVVSESIAGRLLRRLLPAIVLVPSVLGWIQLRGEDAGDFDQRYGEALMTLATVVSLTAFVWIIATSLHRSELARQAVQNQIEADGEAMKRMNSMASLFFPPSAPLAPVLEEVVAAAIAISNADFGNIQMLDEHTHDLHIAAYRGFPAWWLEFWNSVSRGKGACGTALEHGERVIVEDVENSPIFAGNPALEIQRRAGVRAVVSTPLYTRSGEPIGMISTHFKQPHRPDEHTLRLLDLLARQVADILERARADRRLLESEQAASTAQEQLRSAQRVARIGTFDWDVQAGVTTWTPEIEQMYGQPVGGTDRTFASWERLVHPDDREAAARSVKDALATGLPTDAEWRVCWPDHSVHWIGARFQAFKDAAGNPLRLIGINVEITERKLAEEKIRDLTRDLEARVEERTREVQLLLREIHHRVKNNLQVISSLFYLQAQQTKQATVRRLLDESRGRLQSIALIHEKLYRSEQLAAIDFGDYLRDLVASLMAAIGVQAPHVRVYIEGQEVFLDIDRALPCALIINELISNSLKHGFPGDRSGEVHVAIRKTDTELQLEVRDTGIGFPQDLDFRHVTTLGLQLVTSLTKQLQGTVELVREPGTTFRVHVPYRAAAARSSEPVAHVH